jgi:CP family cyanate transporter-like MFS transporter
MSKPTAGTRAAAQVRSMPAPGTPAAEAPAALRRRGLIALGVVLVALNLRPAVAGLGPLLQEVRGDLQMSGAVAGLLTSLPTVCFAIFGSLGPLLARRFGRTAVVCAAMLALTAGLLLRSLAGGTLAFLAATMLSMAGIAVSNVLLPVLVKREFPERVGLMTGVYSMSMAAGTAFAAAAAVPLEQGLGGEWRPALASWAAMSVLAVLPWAGLLLDRERRGPDASDGGAAAPGAEPRPRLRLRHSRTAWMLTVFFGVQSGGAYSIMGWLPQVLRDSGVAASSAGQLLAVTQLVGVPMSFVIPALAGRLRDQRPVVVVLVAAGLSGYAGLIFAPAAAPLLWALLIGLLNSCFPLALIMIGMRARTGDGTIALSSFTQSLGYLLSVPVPIAVGALYQATGGWTVPLSLLAALMLPQLLSGLLAGRNRYIEDEAMPSRKPEGRQD